MQASKVGRRGTIVIPAPYRKRFGLEEGALFIAEAREEGILIRPAVALPVEVYTPERKARFLLENAVDEADYLRARSDVEAMGLSPDEIEHERPGA